MSRIPALATTLTTVLLLGTSSTLAAELEYVLDLGFERTDNVTLSSTDRISQDIARAGLGFNLSEEGASLQASIAGHLDARTYLDNAFSDTLDGVLSGRVNWVAVPQRLSFTIEDHVGLQSIDTFAAETPSNRQQTNVLSLGPTLFFDLSRNLRGEAELRYVDSDAEVTEEFNSQRLGLALRVVRELSPISRVSFNVHGQRVDFEADEIARDYDRLDAFARYARELARFDLALDAGYSRLAYADSQDRRSSPLLRADLGWRPSERSRFGIALSQQFSDAAIDATRGVDTSQGVPGAEPVGNMVVSSSAFKQRRLALDYAYTGDRATFTFAPYLSKIDYVDSDDFDQRNTGMRAGMIWRLSSNLSLDLSAVHQRIDYDQLEREDETRQLGASLRRQWSTRWSSRIEWANYRRESTIAGLDAEQNTVFLSVTYTH